jgi:hypothetical protein
MAVAMQDRFPTHSVAGLKQPTSHIHMGHFVPKKQKNGLVTSLE